MTDRKSILITGGSSGIGEALARAYAEPGIHLALSGRNAERLEAVAEACRAAGATASTSVLDVVDREAMARWVTEADAAAPLDLVIANAGTSAGTGGGGEDEAQARRIMAVNLEGVMNTVLPALPQLRVRRRGQIAIISSLSGFRGFPGAPAYCASKAAVRIWGESLRGHLAPEGIAVSVVCPGFVKSRITAANRFPMPFLMEAAPAAAAIRRGLARNKGRITFPWPLTSIVWLLATLPPGLTDRLLRRLPEKN